ncbi:hypothetical protein ACH5RR_038948 [Cinchona calisaya]|uniref:Uncharacterized protein n=1 Tax=Cinchona calisaya TaxID=153742 RepID=A0ABD2Y248_9GENT
MKFGIIVDEAVDVYVILNIIQFEFCLHFLVLKICCKLYITFNFFFFGLLNLILVVYKISSLEPDALFARGTPPKTSFVELPSPITGGEQAREQDDGSPNSIYMGFDPSIGCAKLAILKSKRGPIRNIALSKKRKAGVKIKVDVSEENRRLIGEGAQSFILEASCVIRKFGKWTKEVALLNRPEHVKEADWIYLCDYICSSLFKEISERNKQNRAKQKSTHTTGTKSYLRHKEEREAKEERVIGPIELYDMTHFSRKKNGPIDELVANNLIKMKDLLSKYKDEGSNKIEDDVCVEVVGHVLGFVKIHSSNLQRNQTKRNGVVALFAHDGCFGAVTNLLVV